MGVRPGRPSTDSRRRPHVRRGHTGDPLPARRGVGSQAVHLGLVAGHADEHRPCSHFGERSRLARAHTQRWTSSRGGCVWFLELSWRPSGCRCPSSWSGTTWSSGSGQRAAGFASVALPGAVVWHHSGLDENARCTWQAYFMLRNRIVTALLNDARPTVLVAEWMAVGLRHPVKRDPATVALRWAALKDVLHGPGWLHRDLGTARDRAGSDGEARDRRAARDVRDRRECHSHRSTGPTMVCPAGAVPRGNAGGDVNTTLGADLQLCGGARATTPEVVDRRDELPQPGHADQVLGWADGGR